MSKSYNHVVLMGNLTRDPELRQTPSGQSVTNFTLALNRSYKDSNGEWQQTADFIDVVAWGTLGENVSKWVSKGRPVLVSGSLQSRSWEQDGNKRSKVEVLARDVTFLGGGKNEDQSSPSNKQDDTVINDVGDQPINLDDIPF